MSYKILALIGEAGSGKDTVMQETLKRNPKLHEIISFTTRPPREGEADGVNYHFVSGDTFTWKILNNEMLEATCFNEWFYGTGYESLRSDCVNIGVFNPEGIDSLMAHKDIEIVVFYVRASDKERMLRQLNREKDPDVHEICRRFHTDWVDFADLDFHYNEVWNETKEDLDYCVKCVEAASHRLEDRMG
mgnify:CR=1 FL=1